MSHRMFLVAMTCLALLAVGCETEGDTANEDVAEVEVVDLGFEPQSVEVQTGTTVQWTNTGSMPHTVTFDGEGPDLGQFDNGESVTHSFGDPGEYAYVCSLHPEMTGMVIVVD